MNWIDIIGLKVASLHTYGTDNKLDFILFNDEETFIEFTEQSPYDYHDCAYSARIIELRQDKKRWQEIQAMPSLREKYGISPF